MNHAFGVNESNIYSAIRYTQKCVCICVAAHSFNCSHQQEFSLEKSNRIHWCTHIFWYRIYAKPVVSTRLLNYHKNHMGYIACTFIKKSMLSNDSKFLHVTVLVCCTSGFGGIPTYFPFYHKAMISELSYSSL